MHTDHPALADLPPDELEEELDAAYAQVGLPRPDDPDAEPWRVDSLDRAAWASRKLHAAYARVAKVDAWHKAEQERLAGVAQRMKANSLATIEFLEGQLGAYLLAEIEAGELGGRKSLALPGGTIKAQSAKRLPTITNAEAFLAWAKKAGRTDLIRTKDEVDKAALNAAVTITDEGDVLIDGEIVEGAAYEPQPAKISFAPKKGAPA